MSRRGAIGAALLLIAAALIFWRLHPLPRESIAAAKLAPAAPVLRARAPIVVPGIWPARTPAEIIQGTPDGVLHYADELNAPNRTAQDDVQLLVSLLQLYRNLSHQSDPVGNNAEIIAALTGKNKLGYAFIRPDHPAINAQGELCDRWGTPYYFHQISGSLMQVRSAGPDREHWTADDIVSGP